MTEGRVSNPPPAAIAFRRLFCARAEFEQVYVPRFEGPPPQPKGGFPVEVTYKSRRDDDDERVHHVELGLTIEPDMDISQPYRIRVAYAGEFLFSEEIPEELHSELLEVNCPAIMFPFLREAISSLTARGTSGPLLVPPLNLTQLFGGDPETAEEHPGEAEPGAQS